VNARAPDAAFADVEPFTAGRSCPLSYRYSPESLAAIPATHAEVLYCVGGLYGNAFALHALKALIARERHDTHVVFNGDFHWFDATPDAFADIDAQTSGEGFSAVTNVTRLRGNVETEIAEDNDSGCGCAYPDSVDDGVVARSNEILRALRAASVAHPERRRALAALPMIAAYQVVSQRVIAVHGDLESLAGWRFDPHSLDQPSDVQFALTAMRAARADIVASSHTCLPALRHFANDSTSGAMRTVVNNGAAGMPCFTDTQHGVVTRIARAPAADVGIEALYGVAHENVWIEAIALHFDFNAWRDQFLRVWPAGSAAHQSYFSRISHGPRFTVAQALGARR
jgi:hypothetical protein